ncbi:hypothetical protein BJY04DRAFT_210541 [Aspergillus karnatakaensis]|uniref:uncharacterized protein n=1 Tax=Aspergillus karnatakaensis TaxID=1810916 RepID=UPI003CCD72AE
MELDTLLTRPYDPAMEKPLENAPTSRGPLDLYSMVPYPEDYRSRADVRKCFAISESKCQVDWSDVVGDQVIVRSLSSLAELRGYRSLRGSQTNSLRILSVNQTNSWKRLNVTRDMFEEIADIAGASSDLLELPLSFFLKQIEVEEGFSAAPILRHNGNSIETIYTMKYAFEKPLEEKGKDPWVLRQTGVYHKYEFATKNSTWVFMHAKHNCEFQKRLLDFIKCTEQRGSLYQNPLLIHSILFGTFFGAWRDYVKELERRVLPIANSAVAAEFDEPLRVNHESLKTIRATETRCLVLQPIFRSLDRTFDALHQANAALLDAGVIQQTELKAMKQLLNNYSGAVNTYGQAAWSLHGRTSRIATHITDTLSFKDAYIAKRQTEFMLRDSTTVRVITVVTLIYLPSTFMATLLGMNSFFEMDDNRRLVVSPQFWIYIVCAIPLTAATLCYWWYFQKAKQRSEQSSSGAMMV